MGEAHEDAKEMFRSLQQDYEAGGGLAGYTRCIRD